MNDKSEFYLLKSVDKKGKSIFAQRLLSKSTLNPITITYRAEYALRCRSYKEIKEVEKEIKECGNSLSEINFKIVKYLMPKEQLSWSPPRNYVFREFEDLLNGKGYE